MGLGGINFAGLSSGIDTEAVIKKLMELARRPQNILKDTKARLQQRQTAYNVLNAQLLGLQTSFESLGGLRAFDLVSASSSDDKVATATAQTGTQLGTHTLSVTNLAAAERITSAKLTSQTDALGFKGQIVVNGKAVNVQDSDSLQTLAANINAAQAGVTASIVSPTAGEYYLTVSSNNTGLRGVISISDTGSGDLLARKLGLFKTGSTSLRHPINDSDSKKAGAGSDLFTDSGTSVGTLLGLSTPTVGKVKIGEREVEIDLSRDSLSAIAAKITLAKKTEDGINATVVTTTDPITGASRQQLQITGTQRLTDSRNVLANLGLLQNNVIDPGHTVAEDARFTLDGLSATRATNTFADAISGLSITLLKAGADAKTTLTVSADTKTIKSNISAFVKAFNDTVDAVSNLSQYDSQTSVTGPLFGDATTQNVINSLVTQVTGSVRGLPRELNLLSQAGITLDVTGHLALNDTALQAALDKDIKAVGRLFRSEATSADPRVQFVSAGADTEPSGATGYSVVITQPATQATITVSPGIDPVRGRLKTDELVTFGGSLFGTVADDRVKDKLEGYKITLRAGSTLADIVSQINGDSRLSGALTASIENGKLKLVANQYGSNADFAILSSAEGDQTSGIGRKVIAAKGKDVAGTINGEVANGSGQFLMGAQNGGKGILKGKASGLQLRITATTAGNLGNVVFTKGLSDSMRGFLKSQTDGAGGTLTQASNGLATNVKDIQADIDALDQRLKAEEQRLRDRFAAMEGAVARIRSSSSGLLGLVQSSQNSGR